MKKYKSTTQSTTPSPRRKHRGILSLLGRTRRDTKGATAVEFGLTFLPIVLLISFIFEGGRLLLSQGMLNYAAQQATRFAVVNFTEESTDDAIVAAVKAEARQYFLVQSIPLNDIDVSISPAPNRRVVVNINYTFQSIMPVSVAQVGLIGSSVGFRLL